MTFNTEIQETVITNAFLNEIGKTAGLWENAKAFLSTERRIGTEAGLAAAKARMNATKLTNLEAKQRQLKFVADKNIERLQGVTDKMPEVTETKKKKNIPLILAGLGLGGLGFGYYQYKRDQQNDQLAGPYSQVS